MGFKCFTLPINNVSSDRHLMQDSEGAVNLWVSKVRQSAYQGTLIPGEQLICLEEIH